MFPTTLSNVSPTSCIPILDHPILRVHLFELVQLIRRVLKSFLNFFLEKISVSGPLKGWTVKPPVRTTLIFSLKPKFRINKHDLVGIIQNCENEKNEFSTRKNEFSSPSHFYFFRNRTSQKWNIK